MSNFSEDVELDFTNGHRQPRFNKKYVKVRNKNQKGGTSTKACILKLNND